MKKRGKKESDLLLSRVFGQSRTLPGIGRVIKKYPVIISILFVVFAAILILQAPGVRVQDNIMEMEAEGLESVELQDRMVEEFDMAPDCLYVRTESLEHVKEYVKKLENLASVKMVDSIAPYLITETEEKERIPVVNEFENRLRKHKTDPAIEIDTLAEELDRLWMNFAELSLLAYSGGMKRMSHTLDELTGMNEEGEKIADSVIDTIVARLQQEPDNIIYLENLQQRMSVLLQEKLLLMTSGKTVSEKDLPSTIRNSYLSRVPIVDESGGSKSGTDYLISIFPTLNPWIKENREVFVKQVDSIVPYATGMILAADQMTQIAEVDAVNASIVAFIIIFLLLLLDLKNMKLAFFTMLPLGFALFSLFGIMALTGIKFDFVNIIGIPLVIGIGIDDAVHISHRYIYEGKGNIETVITKTGAAVFMTSLTTMIGFASFIPSVMRAMKSTGVVLTIAIGLAFFFSIIFHSSLLVVVAEKLNLNIMPWKGLSRSSPK